MATPPPNTPAQTLPPPPPPPPPPGGHAKKGVGAYEESNSAAALRNVNVAWVYNWGTSPSAQVCGVPANYVASFPESSKDGVWPAQGLTIPSGVQFIPLVQYPSDVTSSNLARAKANGETLLTFNEPDRSKVSVAVSSLQSSMQMLVDQPCQCISHFRV
jgi:hypothetical protein